MKNLKRNTVFIWLIAITAFIAVYSIVRISGPYREVLKNSENIIYKNVLFEAGLFIFVLSVMFLGGYYIYQFWDKKDIVYQNILAICLSIVITLFFSVIFINFSPYAMPVMLVPLILTFISDRRTAVIMTIVMTLLILPVSYTEPGIIFISIFTGIIACILASKINQRREFPVLGIALALCNVIILFVFYTLKGFEIEGFLKDAMILSIITFACVVATIGVLPFFETIWGIISPFGLMDLANPTHKLLKRLTVEAPGTYYHSVMVGNLAEAAADKIGANPLLARVGAYYHDIGKLKEPLNFMENQHGENVHDKMDPYESAVVIKSHTEDGVKIAEKYRLPPQIVEVIGQHHGNTIVTCFYNKACEEAGGGQYINQEDFRYRNSKPSSREAAIVMLADSVEAATKALNEKDRDKILERIDKVIDEKIIDGQLDDCPLTLRDINIIKNQFVESIEAYYHKRDEYPSF